MAKCNYYPKFLALLVGFTGSSFCYGAYSWYSTITEMKKLMVEDHELRTMLLAQIEQSRVQLESLKQKLNIMKEKGLATLHSIENSTQNICQPQLLSRYTVDWKELLCDSAFPLDARMRSQLMEKLKRFPGEVDMEIVLKTLLKLQKTYNLKTEDLAEGYVLGEYAGQRLPPEAITYLSYESCENENRYLCESWSKEGLKRISEGEELEITEEDLLAMIEYPESEEIFEKLCGGEAMERPERSSKNLSCYMWDNFRHPWLILQPVPMEILSDSPNVVRFYNVISDEEIKVVKSLSMPKLGRARAMHDDVKVGINNYRIAHNCWLGRKHPMVKRLDYRVGSLTGLSMASAEELQVATYGIGGHYSQHFDMDFHDEEKELKTRNRKATFLFYLSDVKHGGGTVFMHPKIVVKPVKGSAVFWHNLLPSGMPDNRTVHGSCSVLVGEKWIANKWIRETKTEVCKPSEYIGRIH